MIRGPVVVGSSRSRIGREIFGITTGGSSDATVGIEKGNEKLGPGLGAAGAPTLGRLWRQRADAVPSFRQSDLRWPARSLAAP